MLLDIPIKECNVDGHINIYIYIYNKRSGCLPQSASFKVIELDFLTYLLIDAKPWSFMQESEVSMQLDVASCNPSWFACNIFICRKSTVCVFICQCHWVFSSAPSLWMYAWWKHRPSSPSLLSSSSSLSCSHRIAPASSSWIFPCVQNRTYTKI